MVWSCACRPEMRRRLLQRGRELALSQRERVMFLFPSGFSLRESACPLLLCGNLHHISGGGAQGTRQLKTRQDKTGRDETRQGSDSDAR